MYYHIIHLFVSFLRPPVARARKRTCVEPWVIGLISFLSLIVVAVCIGLTVHYVRYSKYEMPWYHVTCSSCFLMEFPVLACLGVVSSSLWFICIAKNSLTALFFILIFTNQGGSIFPSLMEEFFRLGIECYFSL